MRKLRLLVLSVICALTFVLGFFTLPKNATLANKVLETNTQLFLPSSPIEFYDLNSPIGVSYSNDGYLVISEYYQNTETNYTHNRVNVYNPNTKTYSELPPHSTLSSISQVQKYGEFIYYVSQSQIYYIPVNDLKATPKVVLDDTGMPVIVANYFSFYEDKVVANTNNYANIYQIISNSNAPTFKKLYHFETFAKAGFFAKDGNIYLLDNGTLKFYRSNDKTMVTLSTINKDVISFLDLDDYVWFTAIDGLYKIKKEKNATAELIIPVNDTATTLGYLRSPKGLTEREGKILICDEILNCIQEVDPTSGEFTFFAITTEATADYRLTKEATNVILSENYVYALDNATFKMDETKPIKRIVKVSKDKEKYPYRKIDLTNLYEENENLEIKSFTASDTHILIYDGEYVNLYKQTNTNPITLEKLESYQSASVTSLYYLDDSFYFTDTSREDYVYDVINIHKITIPTENNEIEDIEKTLITKNTDKIKGIAVDFAIDIFGNAIIAYKETESTTSYKLTRFFNGKITSTTTLNYPILSLETDFSGNIYILSNNNKIYKYTENNGTYNLSNYTVNTLYKENVETLALNYRTPDCYYLGDACIYKNADDNLNIKSLSGISAENVKTQTLLTDVKFVTVKEGAKLFKVKLNNYKIVNNKPYFIDITPITNPNVSRIYTVIGEVDKDYLLISYSQNLVALIRKTSINPINGDASYILDKDYANYNITSTNGNGQIVYLSNNSHLYAKPIVDNNYKLISLSKGQKVYAYNEYKFNKTSMTLISLEEGGAPLGYIVSGYLQKTNLTSGKDLTSTTTTIGSNASKRVKSTLFILIISLTLTLALIFIESKTLFKEEINE